MGKNKLLLYTLGYCINLILFGGWFAYQQVVHVSGGSYFNYPYFFFFITVAKVFLYVNFLVLMNELLVEFMANNAFDVRKMFVSSLWFLGVFFGVSLLICIVGFLIFRYIFLESSRTILKFLWEQKINVGILSVLFLWFALFPPVNAFSPLYWGRSLVELLWEELPVISPLYKSFLWAKHFSFSNVDYSYWASIMHVPTSYASPFLQFITLVFDVPSIDVKSFHFLLLIIFYLLCVFGSFGLYFYLYNGLAIHRFVAIIASLLFVYGNKFIGNGLESDGTILLSAYLLLPWALYFLHIAMQKNDRLIAGWSGIALALPFYFSTPHPDMMFYCLCIYACVGFFNVFLWAEKNKSFKDHILIFVLSLISFLIASMFYIGPVLWDQFQGNMHIVAHALPISRLSLNAQADLGGVLSPYKMVMYVSLFLIMAEKILIKKRIITDFFGFMFFIVLVIFLLQYNSIIAIFSHTPFYNELLNIPLHLNFDARWRFYMAFVCCVLIIFAMGMNAFFNLITYLIIERIIKFSWLKSRLFLNILSVSLVSFLAIYGYVHYVKNLSSMSSQRKSENPQNCDYYIGMSAILANYPGLKNDNANANFIRSKLIQFENQLIHNASQKSYLTKYKNALVKYKVDTVYQLSNENIVSFANSIQSIIDDYYLDKTFHCINPLLFKSQSFNRRILKFNIDGLYGSITKVNPYFRILGMTGDDGHLGLGSGMLVNNATTSLDTRFMTAYPMLTALYLIPFHNYKIIGTYSARGNWKFTPPEINNESRKLFNVAGIDIFTYPLKSPILPEALPISYSLQSSIDPHHKVYLNKLSYGVAYIANDIEWMDPKLIRQDEEIIKNYFNNRNELTKYEAVINKLYQSIYKLKNKQDVLLEADMDASKKITRIKGSQVKILGIIGERAAIEANCLNTNCLLVFNMANFPGWNAFVNSVKAPIFRVNYAFMGVWIKQGKNDVWFVYQSISALIFYCFSLIFLTIICLLSHFKFWK